MRKLVSHIREYDIVIIDIEDDKDNQQKRLAITVTYGILLHN